MTLLHGVSNYR